MIAFYLLLLVIGSAIVINLVLIDYPITFLISKVVSSPFNFLNNIAKFLLILFGRLSKVLVKNRLNILVTMLKSLVTLCALSTILSKYKLIKSSVHRFTILSIRVGILNNSGSAVIHSIALFRISGTLWYSE